MKNRKSLVISLAAFFWAGQASATEYSDGFNYPVGPGGERVGSFDPPMDQASRSIGNRQGYYVYFRFSEVKCSVGIYQSGRCNRSDGYIQYHLGEDWNGTGRAEEDSGHPVYAASNGRVVYSGNPHPEWGNVVIVESEAPSLSRGFQLPQGNTVWRVHHLYGHLLERTVVQGEVVQKGQMIGRIGTAEGSTGPHLHFEIRTNLNGTPSIGGYSRFGTDGFVDPSLFIEKNRTVFGDVAETAWYATWVKKVAMHRVVSGMRNGSGELTGAFNPNASVTRAEFVKMALLGEGRGFGIADAALSCPRFSDVPMSHPLYRFVQFAKCQGIVAGDRGTNNFRPNDTLNRAEAAKIVAQTWGFSGTSYDARAFTDIPQNAWYTPFVMACYRNGVFNGYPDGTFRAGNILNRAEAAKVIGRALTIR